MAADSLESSGQAVHSGNRHHRASGDPSGNGGLPLTREWHFIVLAIQDS